MSQGRDGKIMARGWHSILKKLKGAHVICTDFLLASFWHILGACAGRA
jgi:hypothetical protein